MRIGHGYDVHRFGAGDFITLGGVRIPHKFGLVAHSDGDVLLHALSDALLGAAALGDIGRHFPDTDPQWKGVSSLKLLREIARKAADAGWRVGNCDVTLAARRPLTQPESGRTSSVCANAQLAVMVVSAAIVPTSNRAFLISSSRTAVALRTI